MEKSNRRNFLKTASLTAGLIATARPENLWAAEAPKAKKINLSDNQVLLFQGDSITDAGRNRNNNDANSVNALGTGYAFLAAAAVLARSGKKVAIYNRGISGNKVYQLAERWDNDAIALKPAILSVLIGVNDYWHKHNKNYNGTVQIYDKDYRALLDSTKRQFPEIRLIIGEPFAVKGVKAVDDSWYPEFDKYREVAKQIARDYNAVFIPYQSVFDNATKVAPANFWTYDGVHPTIAGNQLMADAWLEAIRL